MPADYNSTARALAQPVSPPRSPTQPIRTSWTGPRPISQSRSRSPYSQNASTFRVKAIQKANAVRRKVLTTAKKLTPLQRVLVAFGGVTILVLGILFFVFNERIFGWLKPIAERWRSIRGGWLILWAMTFATGFPPVIGYSTCVTISGFVYGFPNGWFIVATATVAGSTCSFLVSRTILSNFVHRLVANDTRFAALSLVLKHDGLKLLIMIRLCPLPYSISNGAISTFPTVQPLIFALATAIASPKLLIHVFIGARMAAIAGGHMDAGTKAINYISIIGGAIIGILTGWLIYRRTVARSNQLEAEQRTKVHRNPPPRTGSFSDDPDEEHTAEATILRDDDIDFLQTDAPEYRDEFTDDDDDDAFPYTDGAGDEEESIGLNKQPSKH